MQAIGKRLFVVLDEDKPTDFDKTDSGIILSATVEKQYATTGTVVSVGKDVFERGELKVGDRVFMGENHAVPIKIEGVMVVVTSPDGVISIID